MSHDTSILTLLVEFKFVWQDLWIGFFIDGDSLYICLLPMLPIKITLIRRPKKRG